MDRALVCEQLSILNSNLCNGILPELFDILKINISRVHEKSSASFEELYYGDLPEDNTISTYLALNALFLNELKLSLMASDNELNVLSLQQGQIVRESLRAFIAIGIRINLQPKVPQRIDEPPTDYLKETKSLTTDYDRLCYTTKTLVELLPCDILRPIVVMIDFEAVMSALYQIIYCPLKKEHEEIFAAQRIAFSGMLESCEEILSKFTYTKETMLLLKADCKWLQKAVIQNLNMKLITQEGMKVIVVLLLDSTNGYDASDSARCWKAVDVVARLIMNMEHKPEFLEGCQTLLKLWKESKEDAVRPYEMILASCIKILYLRSAELCFQIFINKVCLGFEDYDKNHRLNLDKGQRTIQLLKLICTDDRVHDTPSYKMLDFIIYPVFCYYQFAIQDKESGPAFHDLEAILINFIHEYSQHDGGLEIIRRFIHQNGRNSYFFLHRVDTLQNLLKNPKRMCPNFDTVAINLSMLINLIDLLNLLAIQSASKVYNILCSLVEDEKVQESLITSKNFVDFVERKLNTVVQRGVLSDPDCECPEFRATFFLVTILQTLGPLPMASIRTLMPILRKMHEQCVVAEMRELVISVIDGMVRSKGASASSSQNTNNASSECHVSEFDNAVKDVCDSSLPVRAFGLNAITKMVKERNPEVLKKKLFVLNIYHQNVKHEDSFIYLPAIMGLSEMVVMFPGTVLEILTEEYRGDDPLLTMPLNDTHTDLEMRMKLGEVLIRVSRNLGERISNYKSLLFNAFIAGTRDPDHLMRTSALSNLAELCQVLGYRVMPVLKEVLKCVSTVIREDPAVEPRRAAVAVIRQLLLGLGSQTLIALQDDMVALYTMVRSIYEGDEDSVMRLHAQLALEELEVNIEQIRLHNLSWPNE